VRSGEQDDWVERGIRQFADVVARLAARLGLGAPVADEVIREARAAQGELLGPLASSLPRLDAASAVRLLRDPRAVEVYVELLRVEAAALRLRGDEAGAAALEVRAEELFSS
jgi:hypothetical protein